MAQHIENRIVLSEDESVVFREKMAHPDITAARRRDRTLAWIEEHIDIQPTRTGFAVTVIDDETAPE